MLTDNDEDVSIILIIEIKQLNSVFATERLV